MTRNYRRAGGLAVLAATAAIGLAACGGGATTPHVPTLGNGSGHGSGDGSGGSANAQGNPTQLLDQWTTCIRSHGDPNQVDPAIDSNKDIDITMDNVSDMLENEVHGSTGPCSNYLLAAENDLRGGQPAPTDDPTQDVKFADCMRANGFPSYPDPSANGDTDFNGTGIDPNSTAFQNATETCDKKVGETYYAPGTEAPGVVIVTGCNAPAGQACPGGGPGGPAPGGSGGTIPVTHGAGGNG
jgi:hypothetical protein